MIDHIALFIVGFWVGCGLMMLALFVWEELAWRRDERRTARMVEQAAAEYGEWVESLPVVEPNRRLTRG